MNRAVLSIMFAALPLSILAGTSYESVAGTYRLRVGDETAALARVSGKTPPQSTLKLTTDHHFNLCVESSTRTGTYTIEGDRIVFQTEDSEWHGENNGRRLTLEGLTYVRESCTSPVGAWTVRRNGVEDCTVKINFRKDGRFNFACNGASSSGKWEMMGDKLVLLWTQVDDQPVELGTMRKEISFSDDGSSFNIDVYRYERSQI